MSPIYRNKPLSQEEEEYRKSNFLEIVRILEEEYNIHNMKELDEAIRNMPPINIGVFCAPLPKRSGEASETTGE